jgi:anti-sigma B factor antagonist
MSTEVLVCEPDLVIHRGETPDGVITLTVSGEIDLANATRLRRAFEAELEGPSVPPELHAELSGLRFMDCAGLAALLRGRARALARGSRLRVISASPFLGRLFEVAGVSGLFGD